MTDNASEQVSDSTIEPNGLAKWENDFFGTSDEVRNTPFRVITAEEAEAHRSYCDDLMPNGKSAFENDWAGVSEEDRYKPASE